VPAAAGCTGCGTGEGQDTPLQEREEQLAHHGRSQGVCVGQVPPEAPLLLPAMRAIKLSPRLQQQQSTRIDQILYLRSLQVVGMKKCVTVMLLQIQKHCCT
jgi:hypothetical protein